MVVSFVNYVNSRNRRCHSFMRYRHNKDSRYCSEKSTMEIKTSFNNTYNDPFRRQYGRDVVETNIHVMSSSREDSSYNTDH